MVGSGVNFIGTNCGIGLAELIYVACGIPAYVEGALHYYGTPESMAEYVLLAHDVGAKIIGGCCGTSFAHVNAMVTALETAPFWDFNEASMVASFGEHGQM